MEYNSTWFHVFGGHDNLHRSPESNYLGLEQGLQSVWKHIRAYHLIWAELFLHNPKGPLQKFGYLVYEVKETANDNRIVEGRIIQYDGKVIVMETFHQHWKPAGEHQQNHLWAMGADPIKMQHPQRITMYSGIPFNGEWVSDPL